MRPKRDKGEEVIDALTQPSRPRLRLAAFLSAIASLLWPLQAALVAAGLAGLLPTMTGPGPAVVAGGFIMLGFVRAGLSSLSEGILHRTAVDLVRQARIEIVTRESLGGSGLGSGTLASLANEKLDHLIPFLTRYEPARARVMLLPPIILALAFWHSWAEWARCSW